MRKTRAHLELKLVRNVKNKYLKGGYKNSRVRSFSVILFSNMKRSNMYKLKRRRSPSNIRKFLYCEGD